jgi:branched-subunit amino acid ABC-type transport system permease component
MSFLNYIKNRIQFFRLALVLWINHVIVGLCFLAHGLFFNVSACSKFVIIAAHQLVGEARDHSFAQKTFEAISITLNIPSEKCSILTS